MSCVLLLLCVVCWCWLWCLWFGLLCCLAVYVVGVCCCICVMSLVFRHLYICFQHLYTCFRLVHHTRGYINDNLPGGVCFARSQKGWIVKHKNANGKWTIKKVFRLNAENIEDLAIPQMHYMHSDPHEPIRFVNYVPLCVNIHHARHNTPYEKHRGLQRQCSKSNVIPVGPWNPQKRLAQCGQNMACTYHSQHYPGLLCEKDC